MKKIKIIGHEKKKNKIKERKGTNEGSKLRRE